MSPLPPVKQIEAGGEVALAPTLVEDFAGTVLNAATWTTASWSGSTGMGRFPFSPATR
jgi:hypothetical protein